MTEGPVGPSMGFLARGRAWLVTGPLGRGVAFAIDLAVAIRRGLLRRGGA